MVTGLIKKVIGSRNDRLIRSLRKIVNKINVLELKFQVLSDEALKAKTEEFRARLKAGATLDDLLIEAFAVVREASKRALGMRHFDEQLIGGMVLHRGCIAEMRTGEGKTLVATLPAYLNALTGEGVHIVTVNDYLVVRDATQMSKIYNFLGMTCGVIIPGLSAEERRAAYACDITYGTNNEVGFDYLRDNMSFSVSEQVQRGHAFAIVDEVDSILIDEARTPLIISGMADDNSHFYIRLNEIVPKLTPREGLEGPGDYYLDEKTRQAFLTEEGHQHLEQLLSEAGLFKEEESLYSPQNVMLMHYINAVLRARGLYHRDVHYVIQNGEVVIVDEHTGRAMPGRRWSDGLHQAIEAKEGLKIQAENQTLASITFQNFFRLYKKLAGMTGTADTEAYEFHQIYNLEVVVIPTHRPMIRQDHSDVIYLTIAEKFEAIVKDIQDCYERGQPVLVGTASIESSEHLSQLLKAVNIPHEVLNAKQHAREAKIIANAGRPKAVTIATNMAGRGTDIILGGNWQQDVESEGELTPEVIDELKAAWQQRHDEVLAKGGLHIVGTERHESRRIDNQLRGRSGRQGDPGSSRFYLSMDDHLVRIFASDRIRSMMQRLGMGKGEPLESRIVSRAIAGAQKKVEQYNFDIRKQLLQYDNVANDQRSVIYRERNELLAAQTISEAIDRMIRDVVTQFARTYIPLNTLEEQWDLDGLEAALHADFNLKLPVKTWLQEDDSLEDESLIEKITEAVFEHYDSKRRELPENLKNQLEKTVLLQSLDGHWREHLSNMDHLRQSIHLRGYAQKDPKQEFKRESFELFSRMLDSFKYEVITTLVKVQIKQPEEVSRAESEWRKTAGTLNFQHADLNLIGSAAEAAPDKTPAPMMGDFPQLDRPANDVIEPFSYQGAKVGRNDPCPCGSGKKFKQCHGQIL